MLGQAAYLIGTIGVVFWSISKVIIFLFFHTKVIYDENHHNIIDHLLSKKGYCSGRRYGIANLPEEGYHCVFIDDEKDTGSFKNHKISFEKSKENRGISVLCKERYTSLVIIHKTTYIVGGGYKDPVYYAYILGSDTVEKFGNIIMGEDKVDKVKIKYISFPTPEYCRVELDTFCLETEPVIWQKKIISKIMQSYRMKSRINNPHSSVLISGLPGTGKSTLPAFIARTMQREEMIEPKICVVGPIMTSVGASLSRIFGETSPSFPTIIVMDEFDTICEFAEKAETTKEGACPAKNKASLLCLMDRIYKKANVICIYTTNLSLEEMQTKYPAYIRNNRIEYKITSDCTPEEIALLSSNQ
jgi:DNA replication protein DnaC